MHELRQRFLRALGLGSPRWPVRSVLVLAAGLALGGCNPSPHELVSLARHGDIQPGAPIHATAAVIIEAPRERVWHILENVSQWPRWQPEISKVAGAPILADGAAFTWKTGGTTIHSRVALFSPPDMVAWTGRAMTARAIHVLVLTSLGPNRTRVESRESMDGFLLTWFYDSAALKQSEDTLLKNLSIAAQTKPR